jgi:hypothetical protein
MGRKEKMHPNNHISMCSIIVVNVDAYSSGKGKLWANLKKKKYSVVTPII